LAQTMTVLHGCRPLQTPAAGCAAPRNSPAFSSIRIGLVQPNSTIEAAIWSTCVSLWVRRLRWYRRKWSIGHSSMRSARATSLALCGASVNCEPHAATGGANLGAKPATVRRQVRTLTGLRTSGILRSSGGRVRRVVRTANAESRPVASELSGGPPRISIRQGPGCVEQKSRLD
jgi:hypothetical protein